LKRKSLSGEKVEGTDGRGRGETLGTAGRNETEFSARISEPRKREKVTAISRLSPNTNIWINPKKIENYFPRLRKGEKTISVKVLHFSI